MSEPQTMSELVQLLKLHGFGPSSGAMVRDGVWVSHDGPRGHAMIKGTVRTYAEVWRVVCERFGISEQSNAAQTRERH